MPTRTVALSAALLFAGCALWVGCASDAQIVQERREGMLAEYPPEKTTRANVRARWGSQPDMVATRPDSGWASARPPVVAKRAVVSEQRTGKLVARVERYSGPDFGGSSIVSLCHGWFYYDGADRVVDVEWEYMSD